MTTVTLKIKVHVDTEDLDFVYEIIDGMDIDISYLSQKDESGKRKEMITYTELTDYTIL